jgi:hypothetical protein
MEEVLSIFFNENGKNAWWYLAKLGLKKLEEKGSQLIHDNPFLLFYFVIKFFKRR